MISFLNTLGLNMGIKLSVKQINSLKMNDGSRYNNLS